MTATADREQLAGPRIASGNRAEIGRINALIASVIGWTMGTTAPPRIFTTLSRHRRLYRPWLRFAGALMPGGRLPRADSELVILRVAHNCGSEYEWRHHERMGRTAGLTAAAIEKSTIATTTFAPTRSLEAKIAKARAPIPTGTATCQRLSPVLSECQASNSSTGTSMRKGIPLIRATLSEPKPERCWTIFGSHNANPHVEVRIQK